MPLRALLRAVAAAAALAAGPATADVSEAVADVIVPGYVRLAAAAAALDAAATADCTPDALRAPWASALDAWAPVSTLHLGPVEEDGRALAIAFWPDPKGLGAKAQAALIAARDPVVDDPEAFARVSVAARGLTALERQLWGEGGTGDYGCALTRALAADLARTARAVADGWQDGFAEDLTQAGRPGHDRFRDAGEARQALFTQLVAGLDFVADQRLGRPLGTFDRPRPERAEFRPSQRGARMVLRTLDGLSALAEALAPEAPRTEAAFARARALAGALVAADPGLSGVTDPAARLKIEILQQAVRATRDAALAEIGPALGVGLGFNASDGD